jgi:ABC-type polysaccharide/polyol phosphate transport system ATPase subunit
MDNVNQNMDCAVVAHGVGKQYKIFDTAFQRVNYYLFSNDKGRNFDALHDISFSISKGETFGIIGKNGSGKSTMLQILAGILTPTSGEIAINGKVAALLELGSGFNPESTGAENIYMNAAILGVDKKEIDNKFRDIVEFAEIGDFLYQPVKTYSSGMYVRLAFAVAINVDADIILIDEALAVGDIFFRQKCYSRLNQLKEQGKTIILVTHGMGEVEQFCDRALLLHQGRQVMLGRSQDVVNQYYLINQADEAAPALTPEKMATETQFVSERFEDWQISEDVYFDLSQSVEVSNGKARFLKVGLFDRHGRAARVFEQGDEAYFYYQAEILEDIQVPSVGVAIYNQRNLIVYGKNTMQTYANVPLCMKRGDVLTICHRITLSIEPGEMTFEIGIAEIDTDTYLNRSTKPHEMLFLQEKRICHQTGVGMFTVSMKKVGTPTKLTHHGVCDLPTEFRLAVTHM